MAYRTADYERWSDMDFVVGIEIKLSNNHNCKGVQPGLYSDICDELKGKYPKDFKFVGWHPHCRCHAEPILKTADEFLADDERIAEGKEPTSTSENEVKETPENFNDWLKDNKARIESAKSLPYFIKDNAITMFCSEKMKEFRPIVYSILNNDTKYTNVEFDEFTFGLKATHIEHNIDKNKGWYELVVQDAGYKSGHAVILEKEIHSVLFQKNTEGTWDGDKVEIAAAETGTVNNIRNSLKHCASKPQVDIAIIFFPNNNYQKDMFDQGYAKFCGLKNTSQYKNFKKIYYISAEGDIQITLKPKQ